jgi:hypothetical protein
MVKKAAAKPTKPTLHKQKKIVLADYKKDGKKLIPPYVAALGQPSHISWVDTIIPEVIWIGCCTKSSDNNKGSN